MSQGVYLHSSLKDVLIDSASPEEKSSKRGSKKSLHLNKLTCVVPRARSSFAWPSTQIGVSPSPLSPPQILSISLTNFSRLFRSNGQKKCCLTSSYTPSCATGVTTSGPCEITAFTVPGRKRGLVISITPRMSPLRLVPDNRHQPDSGYRWLLFFVAAVFLGAFVCFLCVSVCVLEGKKLLCVCGCAVKVQRISTTLTNKADT